MEATGFDVRCLLVSAFGEQRIGGCGGLLLTTESMRADLGQHAVDIAEGKPVDHVDLTTLDNPLLSRQGLVVCRYPATEHAVASHTAAGPGPIDGGLAAGLRAALLAEERRVIAVSVQRCVRFLAGRRAGTQKLSAHPVVASHLAALVAGAAAVKRADPALALASPAARQWLAEQVDAVALSLIKLAGGRSMLAGGMVELRTVLLTVNRIYLAGQSCMS